MSISIILCLDEQIMREKLWFTLADCIRIGHTKGWPGMIRGSFRGGDVAIYHPDERPECLYDVMYAVKAKTLVSFGVDKFAPYTDSYGNILRGVVALVKATQADAIAAVEGRPFLRRIDGRVTLYNEGGLFDPHARLQWRPLFDFDHTLQERFER